MVPAEFPGDDRRRRTCSPPAAAPRSPARSPRTARSPSSTSSVRPRFPARRKRVVSAGFTEQDDLLALGVVPIAVTDWFGDEPFGVWPWAQPKLGWAQPAVLNLADGIQVDQIAALQARSHRRHQRRTGRRHLRQALGDRADRRAVRPGRVLRAVEGPGRTDRPGRLQARRHGQAHHRRRRPIRQRGQEQCRRSAARRSSCVERHVLQDQAVVTAAGWRTDFLTQMGLVIPDSLDQFVDGDGDRALVPRDRMASVLDTADVLIWTTESDEERRAAGRPDVRTAEVDPVQPQCADRQGTGGRHRVRRRCCPIPSWPTVAAAARQGAHLRG